MMMMMMIMQMLNGTQNQGRPQSSVDGEPASNEVVIPTPTPTPTPSPEPTRTTATQASSSKPSTAISDAAIVSLQGETSSEASGDFTNRLENKSLDEQVVKIDKSSTAEWELKRDGIF
jgi:hypothetical protein